MALVEVRQCDVFGVKNDGVHAVRVTVEVEWATGWSEVRQDTVDLSKRARGRLSRLMTKALSKPRSAGETTNADHAEQG
jgi:hypothetical protein